MGSYFLRFIAIVYTHFVCVFNEIQILFVDREVREVHILLLQLARVV